MALARTITPRRVLAIGTAWEKWLHGRYGCTLFIVPDPDEGLKNDQNGTPEDQNHTARDPGLRPINLR
jgi:hypothetical protein